MGHPEKEKSPEPLGRDEGVRIHFVNPEILRAHILDPVRPRGATLAERIAGINEIPLGRFPLDGELFNSVALTLVIEPDRNPHPEGPRPTAIIRADLELGEMVSSLRAFQERKISHQAKEEDNPLIRIITEQDKTPSLKEELRLLHYGPNTGRSYEPLSKGTEYDKNPLVLLQTWDKDEGLGSISISLLSLGRYITEWDNRRMSLYKKERDGWEIDFDEVDSWQFENPVGVHVYDKERFAQVISFYQEAFGAIVKSIYAAEGLTPPNLQIEIEAPTIFKEEEVSFADVGGQKKAVEFLRSLANMERSGYQLPRRPLVLLAGPPGNGKTTLVRAVSGELKAPLIVKTTRDLSPTATDSNFSNLLEAGYLEAKAAAITGGGKAVYCLEGVEAMLGRDPRFHDWFLNVMDKWVTDPDNDVLFIATSNFPDNLHPGIVSRFQRLDIGAPNKEGVIEIIKIHVAKLSKLMGRSDLFAELDFGQIAERMEGFSGRDIAYFVSGAYVLRRQMLQEKGCWLPIDTEFLLGLLPSPRKLGFQTE